MAEEAPSRLGRGLAALIGDDTAYALGDAEAPKPTGIREVPITALRAISSLLVYKARGRYGEMWGDEGRYGEI